MFHVCSDIFASQTPDFDEGRAVTSENSSTSNDGLFDGTQTQKCVAFVICQKNLYFCLRRKEFKRRRHYSESEHDTFNQLVTMHEVTEAIHKFSNNKSPGKDGIPAEFFKIDLVSWASVLAPLFSIFLEHSYYPSEFGNVRVVPIYENKGDPSLVTNIDPLLCSWC